MIKNYNLIGEKEQTAIDYGFAHAELHSVILNEGAQKNTEIIEKIKPFCAFQENKTKAFYDSAVVHMDCWGADYCKIVFYNNFKSENKQLIANVLENITAGSRETRMNFTTYYNDELVNNYAYQFIKANEGGKILYKGMKCRIIEGYRYNDDCISAYVLKPKARTRGFHLYNTDIAFLGIENGFIGSMA